MSGKKSVNKLPIEEVKKRMFNANPDVELVGEYINSSTPMKLRCKKDGYEWYRSLEAFCRRPVCPMCNKDTTKDLIVGVNDLATVRPDLVKYFVNEEEAHKYRAGSNAEAELICPNCGKKKKLKICVLTGETGFKCPYCSDNISYSNKFLRSFMKQIFEPLNLEYDLEWSSKWANRKRYDAHFILNGKEYVVEVDGNYHVEENNLYFKIKKEDVNISDSKKTKMAEENGCIMIRIPFYKKEQDYIINNFKNSLFNELFDLNNIDWDLCFREAEVTILKELCDYFNQNITCSIKELGEKFKLSLNTVREYLKRGVKLGFIRDILDNSNGFIVTLVKDGKKIASFSSFSCLSNYSQQFLGVHLNRSNTRKAYESGKKYNGIKIIKARTIDDVAENFYKNYSKISMDKK